MEHSQKPDPFGKKKSFKQGKRKVEKGRGGEGGKRRKNVKKSEWKMHVFLEESSHPSPPPLQTRSPGYSNGF